MKKILLVTLLSASFATQAQTSTIKQELDTALVNKIYSCNAITPTTFEKAPVVEFSEKVEFVNSMVIHFLKTKAAECAGNEAAEAARKVAIEAVEAKPIVKGK